MNRAAMLIVGGGPAGLTTAIAAIRHDPSLRGRITVLEKESYPREKICAGGVGARADRLLEKLGVAVDVPHVTIDGVAARFGRGDTLVREPAMGRVVRRVEFDAALAERAREVGVRIVERARVTAIEVTVEGVSLGTADAGGFEGDVLVGADGIGSVVRRFMGVPFGEVRAQVVELDTEMVAADLDRSLIGFDLRDASYAGYSWDFPTLVDGRPLMCRGAYVLQGAANAGAAPDPKDVLDAHLRERGLTIANYRQKRFAERAYDPRLPIARERIVLVGEAAGIEPLLGEGIAHAILYGALAGRYLAQRLGLAQRSRFTRGARTSLAFRDYGTRVAVTPRLGVDMKARTLLANLFYGTTKDEVERFILENDVFLQAGARYFAGRPMKADLLRSVGAAARDVLRNTLHAQ